MHRNHPALGYLTAVAATGTCTLLGWALRDHFDLVNVAMMYLLAVVFVALKHSRGAAVATSVLAIAAFDFLFVPPRGTFAVEDVQYLFTFAIMLAVALVISRLVENVKRQAREQAALEIEAETERIRSALLASISHDLRTPLAVMEGASSTLAESGERLSAEERSALLKNVVDQSRDMSERVAKLLQMTRLDTGTIRVDRDWASIGEIVASALDRFGERLVQHRIIVDVPATLPLVRVDAALVEQALGNLLENAAKHTPSGTVVRLHAEATDQLLTMSVEDFGGGPADADLDRIFLKFHHGSIEGGAGGVGLGLAICRAIIHLHGGKAWAERLGAGGMAFRFSLPIETAPSVPIETLRQSYDGRLSNDTRH